MVEGKQLRPRKPSIVPDLEFNSLPEYETTSDEEEQHNDESLYD